MRGRLRAPQPQPSEYTTIVWTWHSKVDTAGLETRGLELRVTSGRDGEQDTVYQPETHRAAVAFPRKWTRPGSFVGTGPPGHPQQALGATENGGDAASGHPLGV